MLRTHFCVIIDELAATHAQCFADAVAFFDGVSLASEAASQVRGKLLALLESKFFVGGCLFMCVCQSSEY